MEDQYESYRYPIGRYRAPDEYPADMQSDWISAIEALPLWLDQCLENLDAHQLEQSYRPGGWSLNQVIHHIADSHLNAYIRLKLTLTEEVPEVKTYDEKLWAELDDVFSVPANVSVTLVHALHRRWGAVLRNLNPPDWERSFYHPDQERNIPIWELVDLYAWHGRHHAEQIRQCRVRMGW